MPGDGHDPPAVGHDDVLALSRYVEANLFECSHGPEVRDPWYLRHALGLDFHFPQILLASQLPGDFEVFANRVLHVRQSLIFGGTLGPATWQAGAGDAVPFFGWHQCNWVLHSQTVAFRR